MKHLLSAAIAAAIVWFAAIAATAQTTSTIDGATVVKSGSGARSVVLIPGLGGGAFVWERAAPALAQRYTVYTITFPGFDGVAPTRAPYLPAYQRAVTDLIARERLVKPALIGHSLGGHIALTIAEAEPASVGAVVCVDALPLFPLPQPGETTPSRAAGIEAFRRALADAPADAYALQTRASTAALVTAPSDVDAVTAHALRSDRTTFAGAAAEMALDDLTPGLAKITAPVLVLAAAPSDALAAQYAGFYQNLYAGTPHLDVQSIAPAKHFIMLDAPAAFQRALDAFLAANLR